MPESLIPAEAVQAVIEGIDHESIERTGLDRAAILAVLRIAAPFLAEQARQEERSKIAADLYAESERERERLREWLGLGPDDNPCHHSAAINNAILGWAFAARFVEGERPKPPVVIRNQSGEPESGDR